MDFDTKNDGKKSKNSKKITQEITNKKQKPVQLTPFDDIIINSDEEELSIVDQEASNHHSRFKKQKISQSIDEPESGDCGFILGRYLTRTGGDAGRDACGLPRASSVWFIYLSNLVQ